MPRGGARPNSGPKKGAIYAPTLSKQQARDALREIVLKHMEEMVASQVAHAKGIKYLVARAKAGGKFEKVSPDRLEEMLAGQDDGSVILEVWDKDPSVQAFTDLMNRALDKPAEQEQTLNVNVSDVTQVLKERHARHRKSE